MSRLFMTGWESGDTTSGNSAYAEGTGGFWNPGTTGGIQTLNARTGFCAAASTSAAQAFGQQFLAFTGATARDYFLRIYFRKSGNPTNAAEIGSLLTAAGARILGVRVNTNGTLSLMAADGTTVLGTSSQVLSDGVYYRIEMRGRVGTTTTGQAELQIDGTTAVASVTNANLGTTAPGGFSVGSVNTGVNTGVTFYFDDVAINDSVGTAQNTWPGDGRIVHLAPTADSAVGTGWTLGTGTATGGNAFAAVDNAPPLGVADLAVGSDAKQIRNASANANSAYNATMRTYTAAGLGATSVLQAIQAVAITAAPSATSPKAGSMRILSNPVDPGLVSFGNFENASTLAGTYITGWGVKLGTIYDRSNANLAALTSANYGTAPVMSVNQVTSSTRIAMVAGMHIRVEYSTTATPLPAADALGTADAATITGRSSVRAAADALATSDRADFGRAARPYFYEVLTDSPLIYWRLGETVGSGTVADSSGNGRTGTVGAGVTLGSVSLLVTDTDTSATFNDTSTATITSAYSPWSVGGSEILSFETWIVRNSQSGNDTVWGTPANPAGTPSLNLIAVTGWGFYPNDIGTANWLAPAGGGTATLPTLGVPMHVALTYNPTTGVAELFLNGVSQGVRIITTKTWSATAGNFQVGAGAAGYPFDGKIDEVAVYSGILNPSRILEHFRTGVVAARSPYSRAVMDLGPSLYWQFEEPPGNGKTVKDSSGNGYDAQYATASQTIVTAGAPAIAAKGTTGLARAGDLGYAGINNGTYNPTTSTTPSSRTFSGWIQMTVPTGAASNGSIFDTQTSGSFGVLWLGGSPFAGARFFGFTDRANVELFVDGVSKGSPSLVSNADILNCFPNDGLPHHWCVVYTNGTYSSATPGNFRVSGDSVVGGSLNAIWDEVAVFEKALTAAQVATLYSAGSGYLGLARAATETLGTSDAATVARIVTRAATDTLGTTDAATRAALSRPRSAADSLATTDAAVGLRVAPRAAADTLGTSDAATRVRIAPRAAADTLGTTDAATRALALPRAAADTLGTSDAATRVRIAPRSAADALGTSDAATRTPVTPRSTVDTLGTADAATRAAQTSVRAAADTLGTSDAATRVRIAPRSATDTLGTSDAATRAPTLPRAAADTLGTSDAATAALIVALLVRAAADTLGTTDAATRSGVLPRSAADALGTTDAATRVAAFTRSAADTLGTSDVATRLGTLPKSATDTLGTTDAATRSATFTRAATDTLGTSDAATRAALLRIRAAADTLGTTDAATRAAVFARSAADALGTSDAATRTLTVPRSAADALGTTDAATRAVVLPRSAADALGTTDAATRAALLHIRAAADTLGTSDAATRTLVTPRSAADSLGTTDAATRAAQALARAAADSLGTSDAAARAALLRIRSAADTLGTSDAATRSQSPTRAAADTLGTTDAATRSLTFTRAAADTLGTSDASTRQISPIRSAADTLGTTDAATRAAMALARAAADTLGTSDAAVRSLSLSRTAVDTLGTSDAATRAPPLRARAAADTLGTTDAATRLLVLTRSASDTLGTSDAATRAALSRVRSTSDTLGTTDAATRVVLTPRAAADTLGTSDAATRAALSRARTATDTLGTTDAADGSSAIQKAAADTLGTSDAATRAPLSRIRAATDTLGTSDAATRAALSRARSATDTLGTTDATTRLVVRRTNTVDTLGTSDSARSATSFSRTSSDTLGTSDTAALAVRYVRAAADTLGTTDVATRLLKRGTFTNDTLGTSDRATTPLVITLLTGPTPSKISRIVGHNTSIGSFVINQNVDSWKIAVVPLPGSPETDSIAIPSAAGSIVAGGYLGSGVQQSVMIEGADYAAVVADGPHRLKVFAQLDGGWYG